MGGKSYYCDYCCCFLKNDPNVRKVHNSGLTHTIAKTTYMKRFEDPRKLLQEESSKPICTRYFRGFCKFDLFCQYTHFNEKQLKQLHQIAKKLHQKETNRKTVIENSDKQHRQQQQNQIIQQLPWYSEKFRKILKKQKKLPPSLRALNLRKLIAHLNSTNYQTSWGYN